MKVLYITTSSPFELNSGTSQRSNLILRAIAEHPKVSEIDLLCYSSIKNNDGFRDKISKIYSVEQNLKGKKTILYRILRRIFIIICNRDIEAIKLFKKLINNKVYDLIVFRYINTICMCNCTLNDLIIDVDDLPLDLLKSQNHNKNNILDKLFYPIKYRVTKSRQDKYILNPRNLKIFSNRHNLEIYDGEYLPNVPYVQNNGTYLGEDKEHPYLLFVGLMSYAPNYCGIEYFVDKIWPEIIKHNRYLRLKIIGKGLPERLKKKFATNHRIDVLGFVDDISIFYKQATIVIVPIYSGAGTNIKVLEALAYSKPTVISEYAYRGFEDDLSNKEGILVANDDNSFIQYIQILLHDENLRKTMGRVGNKIIQKNFTIESFINRFKCLLDVKIAENRH